MNMRRLQKLLAMTAALLVAAIMVCGCSVTPNSMNGEASSKSFHLSSSQLNVFRHKAAEETLYTNYVYYAYGLLADTDKIRETYPTAEDYIDDMLPSTLSDPKLDAWIHEYARYCLIYCESAKENGTYDQLVSGVSEFVEDYIRAAKTKAEELGLSFAKYLKRYYGKGTSEEDLRQVMSYYYVAMNREDNLFKEFRDSASMGVLEQYVQANKGNFYQIGYYSYDISSSTMLETIERCGTVEELKHYLAEASVDDLFHPCKKEYFTTDAARIRSDEEIKADILAFLLYQLELTSEELALPGEVTEEYRRAVQESVAMMAKRAQSYIDRIKYQTVYCQSLTVSSTDRSKWLFAPGRKAGDFTVLQEKRNNGIHHTWYLVEKEASLDTAPTVHAYVAAFGHEDGGNATAQGAEAFLRELQAAPTVDAFHNLLRSHPEATSFFRRKPVNYMQDISRPLTGNFVVGSPSDSGSPLTGSFPYHSHTSGQDAETSADSDIFKEFYFSGGEIEIGTDFGFIIQTVPSIDISPEFGTVTSVIGEGLYGSYPHRLLSNESTPVSHSHISYTSPDMADWFFDPARRTGDTALFTVDKITYVALFAGHSEEVWCINARESLAMQQVKAHFAEAENTYGFTSSFEANVN